MVKCKGKELALSVKKARKKEKSHKAHLGKHNSPIMLSDSPSDDEVDNHSDYGQYLYSMVPYGSFDDGVLVIPPIASRKRSGQAFFDADDSE